MKKNIWGPFVVVLALLGASGVEAQEGLPFTKVRVTQAELVRALGQNDMSVLNASCDEIAASATQFYGVLLSCIELLNRVRNARAYPCPPGEHYFAYVDRTNGVRIARDPTPRSCRPGETFIDLGFGTMSLDCGNWELSPRQSELPEPPGESLVRLEGDVAHAVSGAVDVNVRGQVQLIAPEDDGSWWPFSALETVGVVFGTGAAIAGVTWAICHFTDACEGDRIRQETNVSAFTALFSIAVP